MRPRVSLSMIVRDGVGTLGRCLRSVEGLVDDVVVVDTGSTDATRDVAAGFGARVIQVEWGDDFAAARNESLRRTEGDWIFWLDADEWLDDEGRRDFRVLVDRLNGGREVYLMRQVSLLGGPGAGTLSVSQARLFRNDGNVHWKYRVHEQILPSCLLRGDRPTPSDVAVRHSGYDSAAALNRKSERNLRLLECDRRDNPDDPWVLLQLGRTLAPERFDDARGHLHRALAFVAADDPIARQIYPLLARGYRTRGRRDQAGEILRTGLVLYPNDTALVFEAGVLAYEGGDFDRAEGAFTALLSAPPDDAEYLGTVDLSLRGWRARHNLAVVNRRQGRTAEAEAQWKTAVAEKPDAALAWRALVELFLEQSRWGDLESALDGLEASVASSSEVAPDDVPVFRACGHLARGEYETGRELLAGVIARDPTALWPRVLLSRAHLQEGADPAAAERALRDVLSVAPDHPEARANLERLVGGTGLRVGARG